MYGYEYVFLLLPPSYIPLCSLTPPPPPPPPFLVLLLILLLPFVLFSPVHQRKRKADGGFAVPSSKSRSAEAQTQHPLARGSSSSSHGRGGGCAAAASSSSSSCAQQHQEEEEEEGGAGASCRRGGGGGGSSLRERSSREVSRKIGIGREALERLKRCNVPPSAVSEHDVDDRDDPVSCAEYVVDMYKRFKELEVSAASRGEAVDDRKLRVRSNAESDATENACIILKLVCASYSHAAIKQLYSHVCTLLNRTKDLPSLLYILYCVCKYCCCIIADVP